MRIAGVTSIATAMLALGLAGCGGSSAPAAAPARARDRATTTTAVASTASDAVTTASSSTIGRAGSTPTTARPTATTARPAPAPKATTITGRPVTTTTTAAPAPPATGAITIEGFAFAPSTLHVPRGATVTVTNRDSATHTWTGDDAGWTSGPLEPGAQSTHRFDAAGSFSYHCQIHTSMTGTVVVG